MKKQYFDKFIFFLIVLLITFAVFLQITTVKSTDKLKEEEIKKAEQYASKIAKLIQLRTGKNIDEALKDDPHFRQHLNEALQAFLTSQYRRLILFTLKSTTCVFQEFGPD